MKKKKKNTNQKKNNSSYQCICFMKHSDKHQIHLYGYAMLCTWGEHISIQTNVVFFLLSTACKLKCILFAGFCKRLGCVHRKKKKKYGIKSGSSRRSRLIKPIALFIYVMSGQ